MKIIEAKPVDRFHVFLRFDGGASGTVDLSHLAGRGVFRAWQQEGVFEHLSISPAGALQWPGDLDLCPDALYLQISPDGRQVRRGILPIAARFSRPCLRLADFMAS